MGIPGKLEYETDIQASADKTYQFFKSQVHHLPTISSDIVQSIELHEGDWHLENSVKLWTYTLGGKTLTVKETVKLDDENRLVIFVVLEGDILQEFETFQSTVQAIPKPDGSGTTVKWTLEYVKKTEGAADPVEYLGVVEKFTKDVEAHLLKT